MAADAPRTAGEVFDHHPERALGDDVEGNLERNYASDVVLLSAVPTKD